MKKVAMGSLVITAVILGAVVMVKQPPTSTNEVERSAVNSPVPARQPVQAKAHVPAHYENAPDPGSLAPTLMPTKFRGKTKQAYEAARKIPVTLAQLPCYCHCDESVGHKSLHSCFEDQHAASCAVCVDEALLAYKLEKSGKTASQIREQIIAQYSEMVH